MRTKIDSKLGTDFAIALSVMISTRGADLVANPRPVMFMFGEGGVPKHGDEIFRHMSTEEGMDLVCMAFRPGREADGPINISILEERDGQLTTWPSCLPWAFSKVGPCLLIPNGTDFGFGYDGTSLVMVRSVPPGLRAERVKAGQTLLGLMAQCVPADVLMRRLR